MGSSACASCHAAEFKSHSASRHAATMRAASPSGLGAMTPPRGPVPLAGYGFEPEKDRFLLTRAIEPKGPIPLDLALGSGKVGITFISLLGPDTLLQAHSSYFPEGHQWDTTPGHQEHDPHDTQFGRPATGEEARRCVGCHSVTLPASDIKPEPRFYGVGCESCHGPGQAHIASIQAGDMTHSHMEDLKRLTPEKLNDLCGKCHRSLSAIDIQSPEGTQTHRFQPYALLRSRCRTQDGHVLSCMTCHNPHTDASSDIKKYEQECLSCHAKSPPAVTHTTGHGSTEQAKPCPVNATSGCIPCHMRSRRSFPGLFWKPMVDHLIEIPSKSRSRQP